MTLFSKLFELVTAAAGFLGIFLSVVLITAKNGNRKANRYLAVLLVVFSVIIFHSSYFPQYLLSTRHVIRELNEPFLLLVGPFIYFYMREMVSGEGRWYDVVHFIPITLFFGLWLPVLFFGERYILSGWIDSNTPALVHATWIAAFLQMLFYLHRVVGMTGIHRRHSEDNVSTLESISFSWVRNFLIVMLLICALMLTGFVFKLFNHSGFHSGKAVIFLVTCVIYVMGFRGIRQPVMLYKPGLHNVSARQDEGLRQRIPPDEAARCERIIREYMEDKKPYLDADFNLDAMAEALGMHRNHASFVINSRFGTNFFNLVNQYRVEQVKRLLGDPQRSGSTLLNIAMDSGFNSKASFNSIFKKFTGVTPREYRNLLNSKSEG